MELLQEPAKLNKKEAMILWFKDIGIEDVPLVGGKNAALGEMYVNLVKLGMNVPNGFALTAGAYRYFFEKSGLQEEIKKILTGLDTRNIRDLKQRGKAVRETILRAELPEDLRQEIGTAYTMLGE